MVRDHPEFPGNKAGLVVEQIIKKLLYQNDWWFASCEHRKWDKSKSTRRRRKSVNLRMNVRPRPCTQRRTKRLCRTRIVMMICYLASTFGQVDQWRDGPMQCTRYKHFLAFWYIYIYYHKMIKGISASLSDFFTLKLSVTWWPFWLASTSSASVSQSLLTHPGPSWASSELSGSFLAFFCPSGHAPHPALFPSIQWWCCGPCPNQGISAYSRCLPKLDDVPWNMPFLWAPCKP